jgi:hypothetical protein
MFYYFYVLPTIMALFLVITEWYIPGRCFFENTEQKKDFFKLLGMCFIPVINIFTVLLMVVGIAFK